ncbi:MAG TPA: hypothetical protein VE737_06980 [Actinomycetota bacterium]|nr:hypothetical protein [Actinomycetota bacterium]
MNRDGGGTADLPPAVPAVRLADVVAELQAIREVAAGSEDLIEVCRRAESLIDRLRSQFLAEVIEGRPAPLSRIGR